MDKECDMYCYKNKYMNPNLPQELICSTDQNLFKKSKSICYLHNSGKDNGFYAWTDTPTHH